MQRKRKKTKGSIGLAPQEDRALMGSCTRGKSCKRQLGMLGGQKIFQPGKEEGDRWDTLPKPTSAQMSFHRTKAEGKKKKEGSGGPAQEVY